MGQAEIIAFIEERLAEDERLACQAADGPWTSGPVHEVSIDAAGKATWSEEFDPTLYDRFQYAIGEFTTERAGETLWHIVRHCPTRALDEIASKRQILEWAQVHAPRCLPPGATPQDNPLLRALAAPYSDHPDFKAAWRTGDERKCIRCRKLMIPHHPDLAPVVFDDDNDYGDDIWDDIAKAHPVYAHDKCCRYENDWELVIRLARKQWLAFAPPGYDPEL